ncbi:MAG: dUTP diphosphatase, partial [Azonexus sp.]
MPLLFLPVAVDNITHFALLDSGASDSFISETVVAKAHYKRLPLKTPMQVRVANGQVLDVTHYVRLNGNIGSVSIRLFLRIISTPLPIVLGFPFLHQFNPWINWAQRTVYIHDGKNFARVPVVRARDTPPEISCLVRQTNVPTQDLTAVIAPTPETYLAFSQSDNTLFVKLLSEAAVLPHRHSKEAAGYDLSSAQDATIKASDKALIPTDIAIRVPPGTYGRIAPRSGLAAKHFLQVGAGVIDPDYRGNVQILLFNHGKKDYIVKKGDRIAQLLLERIEHPPIQTVEDLPETTRGMNGFGSTDSEQSPVAINAHISPDGSPSETPSVVDTLHISTISRTPPAPLAENGHISTLKPNISPPTVNISEEQPSISPAQVNISKESANISEENRTISTSETNISSALVNISARRTLNSPVASHTDDLRTTHTEPYKLVVNLNGIEEVEPSPSDRRRLAAADPDRKMGKRKKLTARKEVQELIKNMDPATCGPPCQTAPVPPEILKLNEEFKDLFPTDLPHGLPPSRPTDHRIEFPEKYRVPAPRLYRLAPKEDEQLQIQLKELTARGHIKEVTSPFGSGILFVPKANGKLRMVVDYRPINKLTLVDKYPLPRIDEMLDQVGDSRYFSKLDLHSGFHQIRVAPEHVERTAFRTKYGTFAFQVMPFGLCNAPATFQKTMNYVFQDLRKFAGAYIDDILVFTKTLDEHIQALRQVYEKLRKECFFAGPDKCTWAQP